jgi:hypothetical protein
VLAVQSGASLALRRAVVEDAQQAGIIVRDGATATIEDTLVRRTTQTEVPGLGSRWGHALQIADGASVDVVRAWIEDVVELGVQVAAEDDASGPTIARLEDVVVRRVSAGSRGFGSALAATGPVEVTLVRFAAEDVRAAGILVVPTTGDIARTGIGRVAGADVAIRRAASATIHLEDMAPAGEPVAYGLHAAAGGAIDLSRTVVDEGGIGAVALSGSVRITDGVLAHLAGSAAARGPDADSILELTNVGFTDNAHDGVEERTDLPAGSALPAPTAVCAADDC